MLAIPIDSRIARYKDFYATFDTGQFFWSHFKTDYINMEEQVERLVNKVWGM